MQQNIESILDAAEQQQASDVFLQEGEIPRLKINEQIIVLGDEPLSLAHITAFWQACGGVIVLRIKRSLIRWVVLTTMLKSCADA